MAEFNKKKVLSFLNEEHELIEGYFFKADMLAFVTVSNIHKTLGLIGDICEVGVYKGKSLVLLSLLRSQEETVLGFDLFTDDLKTATEKSLAKHGDPRRVELHGLDTNQLGFEELSSIISKPLRFLHIDAGHEYHEVLHQLQLFTPFLCNDAVIALDDTEDREFPGVSAAIHDFCEAQPGRKFLPFCVARNKKYYCLEHNIEKFQTFFLGVEIFKDQCRLTRLKHNSILIFGSKLAVDTSTILEQIKSEAFPHRDQSALTHEERIQKYAQFKFGSGK